MRTGCDEAVIGRGYKGAGGGGRQSLAIYDLGNSRACARTWRSLPPCWLTFFIHGKRVRNGLNEPGEDFIGTRVRRPSEIAFAVLPTPRYRDAVAFGYLIPTCQRSIGDFHPSYMSCLTYQQRARSTHDGARSLASKSQTNQKLMR